HKAWGGARLCERNPRITKQKSLEPVKRVTAWTISGCRPLRGLPAHFYLDPGVALAKPRSTPGFMLSLASRALLLRPRFMLSLASRALLLRPGFMLSLASRALLLHPG